VLIIVFCTLGPAHHFPRAQFGRHFDTTSEHVRPLNVHPQAHNYGWQILIESHRNPHHKRILDSTRGIFFFGTPHQGLQTNELEDMVAAYSGKPKNNLIMQLKEGSEFLEEQKESMLYVWEMFKHKVVSFYETVTTPSVRMVNNMLPSPKCSSKCFLFCTVRTGHICKRWCRGTNGSAIICSIIFAIRATNPSQEKPYRYCEI
jgi:hypothetical protein